MALAFLMLEPSAHSKSKAKRRRYTGPPPTHPLVLWGKTLAQSSDENEKKLAAYKLSQYSQTIHQPAVIQALMNCLKDSNIQIRTLCARAMGQAGTQSQSDWIEKAMLEAFRSDNGLTIPLAKSFETRRSSSIEIHQTLLNKLKETSSADEATALASYFQKHGDGSQNFVETLLATYKRIGKDRLKQGIIEALSAKGNGQPELISLFIECSDSKDTPLSLLCLSGLQSQAKNDPRVWNAIEKTIQSDDTDVLLTTLDLIQIQSERPSATITKRLLSIIEDKEDTDIQEKAVLALGVCGDKTPALTQAIQKWILDAALEEPVRIASALIISKQVNPETGTILETLEKCQLATQPAGLKTACALGQKELKGRTLGSVKE